MSSSGEANDDSPSARAANDDSDAEESTLSFPSLFDSFQEFLNERCAFDCDLDHIFKTLKKHPELAKEQYEGRFGEYGVHGMSPLDFLVASKAPLEMVQEVHKMNPRAAHEDDINGELPLHYALQYGSCLEVIEFLVQENPSALCKRNWEEDFPIVMLTKQFMIPAFNEDEFNEQMAEFGSLPRRHDRFSKDTFTNVFRQMYNEFPPDNLGNSWTPLLTMLLNSPRAPVALLAWLASKQQDYDKICEIGVERDTKVTVFINNLKHFVPMLNCQVMFLRNDWTAPGAQVLGRLLSEVNIPSSLAIHHYGGDYRTAIAYNWSSCPIKELRVTNFGTSSEGFALLIQSLVSMPQLKKLVLSKGCGEELNCTEEVIRLLEEGNLDYLSASGRLTIDVDEFSQFLQKSTSVAFVGYSNVQLYPVPADFLNHDIAYHSSMNQHGRAKITAPDATVELLAEYIGRLNYLGHQEESKLETSVRYGLLRAAPNLWAHLGVQCHTSTKRPASETLESPENKKMK